jgi:ABC-type antimicrobial peptide transport system permease subunit
MYQAFIYAILGIILGMILVFGVIKPYFTANPINFPFSDGILVATLPGTLTRGFILLVTTVIAGYIPARIVVRQNTLSAILGR